MIATSLDIHEVCSIFPMMDADEFAGLKADIDAHGQREPIWTHEGKVIDGRNRLKACQELDVKPRTKQWDGRGSLVEFVVSLNLHRRHLQTGQRAACAAEAEEQFAEEIAREESVRKSKPSPTSLTPEMTTLPKSAKSKGPRDAAKDAAKTFGVGRTSVVEAKAVKAVAPDLHEKVKAGTITLPQAKRQIQRTQRRAEMNAKAEAAKVVSSNGKPPWEIITGDCVEVMRAMEPASARLIFADPPYNIGVDYGDGKAADLREPIEYLRWCADWIAECHRVLADDGSLWVLVGHEYAAMIELILRGTVVMQFRTDDPMEQMLDDALAGPVLSVLTGLARFDVRAWITWHETFGVNVSNNFNRCSRRLFYCVKDPRQFVFNRDPVTRPSDRQIKYDDKRADPGGKLWDDVWGVNPTIPRLVGTAKERIPDFPTQLPLALLKAVVGCASEPGDLIVDPFNGSGTTGEAVIRLGEGRHYRGIEKSAAFADLSRMRLTAATGGHHEA